MRLSLSLAIALSLGASSVQSQVAPAASAPWVFSGATSTPARKVACDCSSYPFTPNPPCYGQCVGKFVKVSNPDLSSVKDLDPGVAVSLKVLAASPNRSQFDFSKFIGKQELELAAQKATQGNKILIEPSARQMQMSR